MVSEYHHPLHAWRCTLDKDDSNAISWAEFNEACQALDPTANIAGAWRVLDVDNSGTISLQEFDPDSAALLDSFKQFVDQKYGSIERAFKAIDVNSSGTLSYTELRCVCKRLKWESEGSARLLFDSLDVDGERDETTGRRFLSYKEVAFLDSWNAGKPPSKIDRGLERWRSAVGSRAPSSATSSSRQSARTVREASRGSQGATRTSTCETSDRGCAGAAASCPEIPRAPQLPLLQHAAAPTSRRRPQAPRHRLQLCCLPRIVRAGCGARSAPAL